MVVTKSMNWKDASENCAKNKSDLVCIKSKKQDEAIRNNLKAHHG